MEPSSPEVIRAAQVLTSRSRRFLSTWPLGQHRVGRHDVTAVLDYARPLRRDQIPDDAQPREELEALAGRHELFLDVRTGSLFATDHVSEPVFRLCADDFFTATGGRFGSLTDYGEELPDWAIPLGEGQTVRLGYPDKSPDPGFQDLLLGLDESGAATWVLTAG